MFFYNFAGTSSDDESLPLSKKPRIRIRDKMKSERFFFPPQIVVTDMCVNISQIYHTFSLPLVA